MAATLSVNLPTYEDLTVPEVKLSAVVLRAGSFHLGKYCEDYNNEFMLCRSETMDPRVCLSEGKAVTQCTLDFFRKVKSHCAQQFQNFYNCIDRSSSDYRFCPCRKTQKLFDQCMKDSLAIDRPDYGYFCRVKVHKTDREKPVDEVMSFDANDLPQELPNDYVKYDAKYGSRFFFFP